LLAMGPQIGGILVKAECRVKFVDHEFSSSTCCF
jgi:hypothetical protein